MKQKILMLSNCDSLVVGQDDFPAALEAIRLAEAGLA